MFDLYNKQARHTLVHAQEGARLLHHRQIDTAHLLFGAATTEDTVVVQALAAVGVDTSEKVRAAIEALKLPEAPDTAERIPFTQEARSSQLRALRWSLELGNVRRIQGGTAEGYIGTEHVVLGLLDKETDTSVRALAALGQEPAAFRAELVEMMAARELVPRAVVQRLPELRETVLRDEAKTDLRFTRAD